MEWSGRHTAGVDAVEAGRGAAVFWVPCLTAAPFSELCVEMNGPVAIGHWQRVPKCLHLAGWTRNLRARCTFLPPAAEASMAVSRRLRSVVKFWAA